MNLDLKMLIAERFRNTTLGFFRIKRNLKITSLSDDETIKYLREIILLTPLEDINTKGKNHYFTCFKSNAVLTINARTLTVITAKQISKI